MFYHYCISLGSVLFVFSIVCGADDRSFWYESGKEADGLLYLLSKNLCYFSNRTFGANFRRAPFHCAVLVWIFGVWLWCVCDLFVDWIFGTLMWVLMKSLKYSSNSSRFRYAVYFGFVFDVSEINSWLSSDKSFIIVLGFCQIKRDCLIWRIPNGFGICVRNNLIYIHTKFI